MGLFPKERESITQANKVEKKTSDEEVIYVSSQDLKYERSELFDNTPVF
jgi:hypothetical protein